jgi:L-alanine-DL-glutamate epimerase-like enolase superfamily enzyme
MKIEEVKLEPVELPYKKPLITASNQFYTAYGFLVIASSDGLQGYGYIDVFPRTGETVGSARYAVEEVLKPVLVGKDLEDLSALSQRMNRTMIQNRRAKGGIEIALYDLLARSLGAPLYVLLGGLAKKEITVIKMVSVAEPEEMARECRELVGEGFSALKLKVSGSVEPDLKRVAAVRDAVGRDVFIKVDANEAFDTKSAIRMAAGLAELEVSVFEQPISRFHTEALAEIKNRSTIKIEADQSADSVHEAYKLISANMCDSINTSILKAGGVQQAKQIADMCALTGVDCGVSNTAGCMVGDAAALHLALSAPGVSAFCEIAEFETISGDPFSGIRVVNGKLKVPEGPGLGVTRTP